MEVSWAEKFSNFQLGSLWRFASGESRLHGMPGRVSNQDWGCSFYIDTLHIHCTYTHTYTYWCDIIMFTNMLDLLYHFYCSTVYNYRIYYVRIDVIFFQHVFIGTAMFGSSANMSCCSCRCQSFQCGSYRKRNGALTWWNVVFFVLESQGCVPKPPFRFSICFIRSLDRIFSNINWLQLLPQSESKKTLESANKQHPLFNLAKCFPHQGIHVSGSLKPLVPPPGATWPHFNPKIYVVFLQVNSWTHVNPWKV